MSLWSLALRGAEKTRKESTVALALTRRVEESQINDPDLQGKNCLMKPAPWWTPVMECAYLEQPIKTTQVLVV